MRVIIMKNISKLLLSIIVLVFSSALFAGSEDWQGTFTIQNSSGAKSTIVHSPKQLIILSMLYMPHFEFSKAKF